MYNQQKILFDGDTHYVTFLIFNYVKKSLEILKKRLIRVCCVSFCLNYFQYLCITEKSKHSFPIYTYLRNGKRAACNHGVTVYHFFYNIIKREKHYFPFAFGFKSHRSEFSYIYTVFLYIHI